MVVLRMAYPPIAKMALYGRQPPFFIEVLELPYRPIVLELALVAQRTTGPRSCPRPLFSALSIGEVGCCRWLGRGEDGQAKQRKQEE